MSLETRSQLGEFVGGFGVIFSLVYLALQVRSNTNSQRADMTARILERLAAQQHTYGFDVEANKFFIQAISKPESLTVEERSRFL
jgi:metal-dependent amidase/aminoacylase/carboxypeptidase family protein